MTTEDKGHSPIGASSASRWFQCPGSVNLIKHSPPQEQSVYAAQGTAAHKVLEECFWTGKDPWQYEGMEYEGGELNVEDLEAVEDAINWLDEKVLEVSNQHRGVTVLKEVGFDLSNIHPELWGTSDIVIYTTDFSFLGVYDYKHGAGVRVEVKNNTQLKYYTLGAINFLGHKFIPTLGWGSVFREVEMGIIQPRCENTGIVSLSTLEIDLFVTLLEMKAKKTTLPDAEFSAGDHCRWCAAKPLCPQLYNKTVALAKQDFRAVKTLDLPDQSRLTPEEIGKIIAFEPIITDWLKSLKRHAQSILEAGREVPGYKLVKKKANRKWAGKDEDTAVTILEYVPLGVEIWTEKLKSPAQIEKLIKDKDKIRHLITKPDNGNTIAADTDRRQAVKASAITDFTKGE